MGLILDSSVLIAAERKGQTVRQVLAWVQKQHPGEEIAVSVLTLFELSHGAARANSSTRLAARNQFIHDIVRVIPVHALTVSIALRAGQIDGECASRGVRVAISDLLIGVTALELGYGVATGNVRHFQMVPGLTIVAM